MNITNKYCLIIKLTTEQLNNLIDLMPTSDLLDFFSTDTVIGFRCDGRAGTFGYDSGDTLISYTEMMQLLGKTMKEFTKSDLIKLAQTETVFVKQREGMYMLVLRDRAVGDIAFSLFCDIRENLLANKYEHLDIVAVYKASDIRCLNAHLKGESLTSIWERIEQTPAQKEMEALQAQIDKGAAYMAELHEQAKRLQAKL
jgi:hypothetical protein